MPQPDEVNALATELAALYEAAHTDLERQLVAALTGPTRERATRLRAALTALEAATLTLDAAATRWARERLRTAYLFGQAAAGLGVGPAAADEAAVAEHARRITADLLDATRYVRARTKAEVRRIVTGRASAAITDAKTATQAAREAAALLAERGILRVRYANGALHTIADYADSAIRTVTAVAYNDGTLTALERHGIGFVEVFDGPGCGWSAHGDTDHADGTVRTIEEARVYPTSHPRCQRAFAGRPDVRSKAEAGSAKPSATPEQQADAVAAEAARIAATEARGARRRAVARREARIAARAAKVAARV